MKSGHKHSGVIFFIVNAFILLSFIASFAGTTTYQYDDVNRKVRVESGQPPAPTYSISGTVTSGGSPLSGVTITLSGAASSTTTTDGSGNYGFTGLANGSYTIIPSKAGYAFTPSSRSVTLNGADVTGQGFTGNTVISAPTNLTATAVSSSQINLSWTDNSNDETGFKIERKTGASGTYSQIATVGANVTTYSDTGLTSNTTYYYRVRAYNAAGESGYSNEANATTQTQTCANPYVRIVRTQPLYYSTLQAAYNAAVNGDIIQSQAVQFTENLTVNRNIVVTLEGGYNCEYTTNSGSTTRIKGMITTTAGGGTITIKNFVLEK